MRQINAMHVHHAVIQSSFLFQSFIYFKVRWTVNKDRNYLLVATYTSATNIEKERREHNVVGVAALYISQIESRNHKAALVSPYRYRRRMKLNKWKGGKKEKDDAAPRSCPGGWTCHALTRGTYPAP